MRSFEQGDIVRVPFPYTDRATQQHRPALVVSTGGIGEGARLLWVVMITSADNRRWPSDIPIGEAYRDAGLPAPSVVRTCKIATIDYDRAARLGTVPADVLTKVLATIAGLLGGNRAA